MMIRHTTIRAASYLTAILSVGAFAGGAQATVIIDDFTNNQQVIAASGTNASNTVAHLTGPLAGDRKLSANEFAGGFGPVGSLTSEIGSGSFRVSVSDDNWGIGSIEYTNFSVNLSQFTGIKLVLGTFTEGWKVDMFFQESATGAYYGGFAEFLSPSDSGKILSYTWQQLGIESDEFSQIQYISLGLEIPGWGKPGSVSVTSLSFIPEPNTAAMCLLALPVVLRRKRMNKIINIKSDYYHSKPLMSTYIG